MAKSKTPQEKRVLLTKRNMDKYPVLYLVHVGLNGLHNQIYKLKRVKSFPKSKLETVWWENEPGALSFQVCLGEYLGVSLIPGPPGRKVDLLTYITPNEEEAKNILSFGQALLEQLKSRI